MALANGMDWNNKQVNENVIDVALAAEWQVCRYCRARFMIDQSESIIIGPRNGQVGRVMRANLGHCLHA